MTSAREKCRKRLNRISGQVTGLQKMLEEDRYCVDILTQLAAVRSALDSLGIELLSDHLEHCIAPDADARERAEAKNRTQRQLVDELRLTLSRFLR